MNSLIFLLKKHRLLNIYNIASVSLFVIVAKTFPYVRNKCNKLYYKLKVNRFTLYTYKKSILTIASSFHNISNLRFLCYLGTGQLNTFFHHTLSLINTLFIVPTLYKNRNIKWTVSPSDEKVVTSTKKYSITHYGNKFQPDKTARSKGSSIT